MGVKVDQWISALFSIILSNNIGQFSFWKLSGTDITRNSILEMWANAQRDGRPAEYRRRPLLNAAARYYVLCICILDWLFILIYVVFLVFSLNYCFAAVVLIATNKAEYIRVPRSNAAKTRNPLKLPGLPQTNERISAASGPKFTILWGHVEEILLFNNFFRLSICAVVVKI